MARPEVLREHATDVFILWLMEQGFLAARAERLAKQQVERAPINLLKKVISGWDGACLELLQWGRP